MRQIVDKPRARTYLGHTLDISKTYAGHGQKLDKLWGTHIDMEHPLFVQLRNRQISLSCLLLSLSFHLSSPPKPSSPFDVRTSLLNVPCCDKAAQPLSLVHAEISLSSFQRKGEYRSKHGDASARPSCILLPWPPSEHRVVQRN